MELTAEPSRAEALRRRLELCQPDLRFPPGTKILDAHPELRQRVLDACRTRGKVETQPESMLDRDKDAVTSLVNPSYREPAKALPPEQKPKPNPPIDSWDLERVRTHLDAGWNLERLDVRYRSALWYACRHSPPDKVRLLLRAGADPRLADKDGITPQDAAERNRRSESVLAALAEHS